MSGYSDAASNILLFIHANSPKFGEPEFYHVVKNAVGYSNILRSKKYRDLVKHMVYGHN